MQNKRIVSLLSTLALVTSLSLPLNIFANDISDKAVTPEQLNTIQPKNTSVDYSLFGPTENESGMPDGEVVQPHHLPTSIPKEKVPRSNLTIDGISLSRQLIPINYYDEYQTPKYIVIHDTGNRARGANAQSHRNYFATNENANSSAHYFIDDSHIIQTVDDHNGSWHCGDGKSSVINNRNTIGIEMCVNPDSNFKETVRHAEELTKYLMSKYNIPAERVVRHNDVSGKICPAMMIEDKVVTWDSFKHAIGGYNNELTPTHKMGKVIDTDSLSVRENGGRNSGIISTLKGGQEVEITGQRLNHWYQVKLSNSKYGYVSNDYIQIIRDLTPIKPIEPPVNETVMNRTAKVINLDIGDNLNFRVKPNANSQAIGEISEGIQVNIKAKCDNGWYKINYNGKDGYVYGYYLELLPEVKLPTTTATLNIRETPVWGGKQIGQIPSNTQVTVLGYTTDFYKVNYNGTVGYVSRQYVINVDNSKLEDVTPKPEPPKPVDPPKPVVKPTSVNAYISLRTLPQWSCPTLGTIPQNSTVEPIGYLGEWIKVKYDNKEGFVNETYLVNFDKSKLKEIPVVKNDATVTASVNLRDSASWGAKQLGVINQGTKVHIVEVEGDWTKIIVNNETGYIYSAYVEKDGADKIVTVTAYVNLRKDASWGSEQLGVIPENSKVKLLEKGSEWTKISWDNKEGYVYNNYIK